MKIKKLHLKKYKRFSDLTIDLGETPKRIIALVGPNGCGKSSVFDAMLFHNNAYNRIGNTGNKTYVYHSLDKEANYNYQNVEIIFDAGTFDAVRNAKKTDGLENTLFSFRSSFRYNGNLNVQESKAVTEIRKNDFGATTAADIDQRIEQSYRRLKIKYDKYMNDNDCRPSEAKAHIIGELNNAVSNCLKIKVDNLGNIEAGQGTFFFKKDDTTNAFEYNVLSSGEKEVVDILLDLYLRKDEYTDSIFIIDEPELHLNTAIQRKLLIEINKMVPENCQIWVATHSIGFLRALQDELNEVSQIIEFKEDNKWASQAYTLRVLNRFEIENYLYDKEVLKKYCEINEKTFDEAAYDAFVTDVVNQQIKDNTGHIRNFCGIVGSINAEVFKKNLAKVIDDSMQVYKELERVIFQRA